MKVVQAPIASLVLFFGLLMGHFVATVSGCQCTERTDASGNFLPQSTCDGFSTIQRDDGTVVGLCESPNRFAPRCIRVEISGCADASCQGNTCIQSIITASKGIGCSGGACVGAILQAPEIGCFFDSCRTFDGSVESTILTAEKVVCNGGSCRGDTRITSICADCEDVETVMVDGTCGTFSTQQGSPCLWNAPDSDTTVPCVEAPRDCPPTDPPTSMPTASPDITPKDGGAFGDPHYSTFSGLNYDYHGECDVILVQVNNFWNGMPLTIVLRSTIRYNYSYLESIVVSIGEEKFQLLSFGLWILNDVSNGDLFTGIAGFPITHNQVNDKLHLFEIDLGGGEKIKLKSFKDMCSVMLHTSGSNSKFIGGKGMMGSYPTGELVSRNGTSFGDNVDPMVLAREWQVRNDEPMLFQIARDPQFPEACKLPSIVESAQQQRRRLGEAVISEELAMEACTSWPQALQAGCVYDVIATNSLEIAGAGAW